MRTKTFFGGIDLKNLFLMTLPTLIYAYPYVVILLHSSKKGLDSLTT